MNRTTKSVAAVIAALAFLLAACSGGSSDSSSSSTKNKPAAASDNDMNPTPRSEVQDGGTMKWPLDSYPSNFNPAQIDGASQDVFFIAGAILPSAFVADAEGNLSEDPNFVESAKLTATSPKQVVTYELNKKAVWDDGTPVTVKDYEGQWKANNGSDEAYQVAATQGYDQIESVKAGKDEFEVVVTFARPYADWKGLFSQLLPASATATPDAFNKGWVDKPLASAGPFKFSKADKTAQTVTLERNDKWWGNPAKLDSIIFRSIDPDTQVDALANKEVDYIDVGPDVDKLQRAENTDGVEIRRAAGPNFRHITINGTGPILKDLQVRRALGLAIDRTTIAKAMLGPLGGNPVALNNHIFMTNQKGYQDNSGEFSKVNTAKAEQVLDEAGWKKGSGSVRTKDGKKLEINIVIPSQVATSKQESELIQGMLAKVGIKLDIEVVPGDKFFDDYITTGKFDLTVFSWIGTPFPVSSARSIYVQPTGSGADLNIQENFSRIGTDEIDAKFDEATSVFDQQKAIDLANAIDTAIWKEVHSLTTYQRPDIIAARSTLANMGAYGFASIHYEDIGFTK